MQILITFDHTITREDLIESGLLDEYSKPDGVVNVEVVEAHCGKCSKSLFN